MAKRTPERLAEGLLKDFQHKQLAPGARIPSFRILAKRFGVSLPTIQRAIATLHAQGYLNTVRGSGTYVTERIRQSSDPSSRSSVVIAAFPFLMLKPELLSDVQRDALSRGVLLTHWCADRFAQELTFEKQLIEYATRERLRAILLFTSPKPPTNDALFQEAKRQGLRIIHLAQYKEDMSGEEYVRQDFRRAGAMAAEYLLRKGYSHFATLIVGGRPDYFGREIRDGFQAAIREKRPGADCIRDLAFAQPFELPQLAPGTGLVCDKPWELMKLLPAIEKQKVSAKKMGVICCTSSFESPAEFPFPCIRFKYASVFNEALKHIAEGAPADPCQVLVAPADLLDRGETP